jgi:membrane protein YqaA with SNARE-associated domain
MVIGGVAIVLNMLTYLLLPTALFERSRGLGYLSALAVSAIANATVLVPLPYYSVIIRLAQSFSAWGVILAAAAGSALGESVAYLVGRSGHAAMKETRINSWIQRQMYHPWRAGLLLFGLSAPPNPAFDVAGLAAGALGVPFWLFLLSVFLGRIIRMGLLVIVGVALAG